MRLFGDVFFGIVFYNVKMKNQADNAGIDVK